MTKQIFGKKIGMTQIIRDDGRVVAVTVIEAKPCVVVRKRTQDQDGYEAVQVGFGDIRKSRVTKPVSGQFKAAKVEPTRFLREIRFDGAGASEQFEVGAQLTVDMFEAGEAIEVSGISKGKGFQGAVKRHNFTRGPMTHGSHSHRRPGSAGATDAARVFKGKKNPGHMGGERVTVSGLSIERVVPDKSLLLVRGAVPGAPGSYVEIRDVATRNGG